MKLMARVVIPGTADLLGPTSVICSIPYAVYWKVELNTMIVSFYFFPSFESIRESFSKKNLRTNWRYTCTFVRIKSTEE